MKITNKIIAVFKHPLNAIVSKILGGRPMICMGYHFTDIVSGKPVYKFIDKLGRIWMAEHKWARFRVECE